MKDFLLKVAVSVTSAIIVALGATVVESWPAAVSKIGGNPLLTFAVAAAAVALTVLVSWTFGLMLWSSWPEQRDRGRQRASSYFEVVFWFVFGGFGVSILWLFCGWLLLDWPVQDWLGLHPRG